MHALAPQENARLRATSEIVSSFLMNNKVELSALDGVIEHVFTIISRLEGAAVAQGARANGAVKVEDSITPDYIVCLEDGKKLKMLKRYLKNNFNLTPEEYRKRWGLPASYPMVAPNYAKKRSELAKDIGLGKQPTRGLRQSPRTVSMTKPRSKATLPAGLRMMKNAEAVSVRS